MVNVEKFSKAAETEKAIALRGWTDGKVSRECKVWIPKSMIKEGRVAEWLMLKKLEEATYFWKCDRIVLEVA